MLSEIKPRYARDQGRGLLTLENCILMFNRVKAVLTISKWTAVDIYLGTRCLTYNPSEESCVLFTSRDRTFCETESTKLADDKKQTFRLTPPDCHCGPSQLPKARSIVRMRRRLTSTTYRPRRYVPFEHRKIEMHVDTLLLKCILSIYFKLSNFVR